MLRLYDTARRGIVEIAPRARTLGMYTCGPTVYRYAHIGNLRTFLLADLIRRAYAYTGVEVDQVQNITDVGHMTDELFDRGEDRMLVQAGIEGRSAQEIAAFYTDFFFRDIDAMNITRARAYPRASEHIPQMNELVAKLLERGHAYLAAGNVYYDVASFPEYGRLSQNTTVALKPGHRMEELDAAKRHHADFLLWKAAGPQRVVKFSSPWGEGYPGWHLECSAMSIACLGDEFDLHTGGVDLIFPHHEDEIAQSDGATGHRVVRHWVHGAHLLAEGRKMSKSAQNFYDLRDLVSRGIDPLAFRLLCLQTRYRSPLNFTWDALAGAATTLQRWRRVVAAGTSEASPAEDAYEKRFVAALTDDLETPSIVALVAEVASAKDLSVGEKAAVLKRWDRVLGLDLDRDAETLALPDGARTLIDQRERARAGKDFATADRLRGELGGMGVEVEDTPEGPKPHVVRRPTP